MTSVTRAKAAALTQPRATNPAKQNKNVAATAVKSAYRNVKKRQLNISGTENAETAVNVVYAVKISITTTEQLLQALNAILKKKRRQIVKH
jgi:uncharacterized membrane protein